MSNELNHDLKREDFEAIRESIMPQDGWGGEDWDYALCEAAINFWNRRSTSGAASGEVGISISSDTAKVTGRYSIGARIGRNGSGYHWEPVEQSAPPVPPMDQSSCIPPFAEPADQRDPAAPARHAIHNLKQYRAEGGMFPGEAIGILERFMDEHFEQTSAAGAATGGITNDNDSNPLATQSASTAPGQAEKLLKIIGYAYQVAGAHDVPDHILDVLADPEEATDEQVEAMLPYVPAQTGIESALEACLALEEACGPVKRDEFAIYFRRRGIQQCIEAIRAIAALSKEKPE